METWNLFFFGIPFWTSSPWNMFNFKEAHFQFIPLSFWNIIVLHEFLSVHSLGFNYLLFFINWENVFLGYIMLKKFHLVTVHKCHIFYMYFIIFNSICVSYFTNLLYSRENEAWGMWNNFSIITYEVKT